MKTVNYIIWSFLLFQVVLLYLEKVNLNTDHIKYVWFGHLGNAGDESIDYHF